MCAVTVIQNGYEELWTVLNWTNPGAVGTRKQWENYVEKPLRVGQSKSSSDEEHVKAAVSPQIHSPRQNVVLTLLPAGCEGAHREALAGAVPTEVSVRVFYAVVVCSLDTILNRTKQIIQDQVCSSTRSSSLWPLSSFPLRYTATEEDRSSRVLSSHPNAGQRLQENHRSRSRREPCHEG